MYSRQARNRCYCAGITKHYCFGLEQLGISMQTKRVAAQATGSVYDLGWG